MGFESEYIHTVQYYETDKMGITHHSNYIRWMEEARVAYLAQAGWDYAKLESMGIVSAVVSLNCDFRRPTVFPEQVVIRTSLSQFKGVTFTFSYRMFNAGGEEVFSGTSLHVFLNPEGRPAGIRRKYPELYERFCALAEESEKTGTNG
ncbi:MAG: acyl-CoA thioesterase [Clostridia bacterium]|nr:acyl-CoA thioesterase [Clostridia bacterium]